MVQHETIPMQTVSRLNTSLEFHSCRPASYDPTLSSDIIKTCLQ